MRFAHLLAYAATHLWALHPDKARVMLAALRAGVAGEPLPPIAETQNHGGVPVLLAADLQAAVGGSKASAVARGKGSVAVLPVRGTLTHRMGTMNEASGQTTYERLGRELRALVGNADVKAIVLDVDSPGGVTDGLPELAADLRALRGTKPIVAQVNTMAASAAYWLASQADDIAITPSGQVGSIGVWTMHEDISAMLESEGVRETIIRAGKFKVEANPFEPLSEETRAYLQAQVDEAHGWFVDDIARGRNTSAAAVRETYGQGRMVSADEAVSRGMADRVATLEQTLNRYGATLHGGAAAPARGRALNTGAARVALERLRHAPAA